MLQGFGINAINACSFVGECLIQIKVTSDKEGVRVEISSMAWRLKELCVKMEWK